MKKLASLLFTLLIISSMLPSYSQAPQPSPAITSIRINVQNDFDDQIEVQLDKGRKFPIGPKEKITLGERSPGKYTLTIYNKKGEFIDNLTRNIGKDNKASYKYDLNDKTVSNSDKITGLSTGQKVAITAGSVGVAALGAALVHKALQGGEEQAAPAYVPPPPQFPQDQPQAVIPEQVANVPSLGDSVKKPAGDNAFAPGGKILKFLNTAHTKVTLIVEGTDGNPIGNNWVIPKAVSAEKPQPLVFNSEKITLNPNQKIKAVLPNGLEIQRYAFELDSDPYDSNSYLWVVK